MSYPKYKIIGFMLPFAFAFFMLPYAFALSTAVAATGALSVAERSYPTSEVRGRSWEDPMPEGRRPRGVTPRLRSRAAAESARLRQRRNGQEELSHPRSGAVAEKRYPGTRSGVAAGRSYPTPKTRGSGWEDQPHVQGAVAVRAQEGLEELSHVEGQEGQW